MEDLDINEPYYRVESHLSCDGSIGEDDEPIRDSNDSITRSCKCSCQSKHIERTIRTLTIVAILALLLGLASVAMVTVQWMTPSGIQIPNKCVCPSPGYDMQGDIGIDNIEEAANPSVSASYATDLVTGATSSPHDDVIDADCPTCRVRRHGDRRTSSGQRRTRHRNCRRACPVATSGNQSSITAIHFQGYPPGVYHLGDDGVYIWWRPASWYSHMTGFHYNHTSGHVTIRASGLYYLYSQILQTESNDQKYAIVINNAEFLKCVQSVSPGNHGVTYESTCYTGGATFLKQNDRVWIKGVHTVGHVIIKPESTFWGLIRLGEHV